MKKNLYGLVLVLIFVPTLIQVLDQLLPTLGITTTPGALLGRLFRGDGWSRRLLGMLTTLGFPPFARGSAVGPIHAAINNVTLVLNCLAVVLAGRRLLLPASAGGNVLPPTFEKPQLWVAGIAVVLLAIALLQRWMSVPGMKGLDEFVYLVTFDKVHGADQLGGILLAFAFWWTEIRNLVVALAK
ncbi:MAG TPA: hypothetical protein VM553_06945 [Dongiaceae bacterium]|nr:hypothetical protein [Dongiaceae bacterium]